MPGIGIILNPYSRANLKDPERIKRLGFIVGDRGSCHSTETLDEVRSIAGEFKERRIDILGLSGGDGTNHLTLSTFLEVYGDEPLPRVALLRGGTMNNLATQLGIRGRSERILSNLIVKYHEGGSFAEKQLPLIRINGTYGFIFGTGVVSRFLDIYRKAKDGPTPWTAARVLAMAVGSALVHGKFAAQMFERFDCRITVDGKEQPFKNYNMIFAGSMETLGFNFRLLYRANQVPGKCQVVAISETPGQLLKNFHRGLLAKRLKGEGIIDELFERIVFEFERPVRYIVDGDLYDAASARIEVSLGPTLTFLVA
jgi:diacylglycerol kinase (ATP)